MSHQLGHLIEVDGGLEWSPDEIDRQLALRLERFSAAGLNRGDRVLITFGNRAAFFVELLAVWRLGGCVVPVDSRATAFEVETLARAAEARFAVVDSGTDNDKLEALSGLGLTIIDTDAPPDTVAPGSGNDTQVVERGLALAADALILFTSGSTGEPKGVVHTHLSLLAKWTTLKKHLGIVPFRRTLCVLPTHFGHGLICNCLFPWLAGQDLVIAPPFRPDVLMRLGETIDRHGITFLSSVPSMWRLALRTSSAPASGTLERIHVGSAPLSAQLWNEIREWSDTREVFNAYGITETGSWIAGTTGASDDLREPADGHIGEPWGAEIRVIPTRAGEGTPDSEGECERGEAGHVWLRTPALMRGYFGRDDLTAAVVRNGWFATGDIGFMDERGRLHLCGREREEINKGGMKIYPGDVDAVAERFHGVQEVCTFAIEDANYGQNVGIALVMERGEAELAALHAWLKEHLAEPKLPVRWFLVEAIPRTSRGKINREKVREACERGEAVDLAAALRRAS